MLIKYKVKLEKNGLTITQEIDSGSSAAQVKPREGASQKTLQGTFGDSESAAQNKVNIGSQMGGAGSPSDTGGAGSPSDTGGASFTAGSPITIFGPFIFMSPDQDDFDELIEVDNDE